MKKAPLALLALGLICCTPQRQDTQYITITTDDAADRTMMLIPMGHHEEAAEMTLEEGTFSATVATSESGFYNLVSVKGQSQTILPHYVPVNKAKSSSHLSFGGDGHLSLQGSRDNRALTAYTAAYSQSSRALWKLPKGDTEAGRDILLSFIGQADSIVKAYKCSAPVAEYIKIWGYVNAYDNYRSLSHVLGIPVKEMPYTCDELLPAPDTMLDSPLATFFPSASGIIYSAIPNKNNLDSALVYVIEHYTDSALVEQLKDNVASRYVSRYDYSQGYEAGLEHLQTATQQYALDPRHIDDFTKLRAAVPGQPFPGGIVLKDPEGNTIDFSSFHGKYVYIDLWASWCVPCLREVPELQKLEAQLKNKNVTFVSVSIDASEDAWKKKLKEKDMHGHQLWNPEGTLGRALNAKGIPFFAIYDPQGKLYMNDAPRPSQGPGLKILLEKLK